MVGDYNEIITIDCGALTGGFCFSFSITMRMGLSLMDASEAGKHSDLDPYGSLQPLTTRGASIEAPPGGGYRLSIPAGPAGKYRVAQLYDSKGLPRRDFLWQVPFQLKLTARISAVNLPGTWGFGLWNDPFSASLGGAGGARKLPALPNTVWFFHASPQNYLSLRDDLPGNGFLTAVFSSPLTPALLLSPGILALPLIGWKPAARLIRKAARRLIGESSAAHQIDETLWHAYEINAVAGGVSFSIDGAPMFCSETLPCGRLGLVIWIDNQYAAFTPEGRLGYGTLENLTPAWLEIRDLEIRLPR